MSNGVDFKKISLENRELLNSALAREAALREEIEMAKQVQEATDAIVTMVDGQRDNWIEKCGLLKQRLTVAEQLLSRALQYGGMTPDWRDSVEEALKTDADCERGYSNQTGCPVCQGIKP